MKSILTLSALLCLSQLCHAQRLVWESNVPIEASLGVTNGGVFPDGKGGGVLKLKVYAPSAFERLVWFDSKGTVKLTNDFSNAEILRVTPAAVDVQTAGSLLRFSKGNATETILAPQGTHYEDERVSTVLTPSVDKRGFFTTQLSQTNLIVRRYSF